MSEEKGLKRSNAVAGFPLTGKGPMKAPRMEVEEEFDSSSGTEELAVPQMPLDLAWYFDQFALGADKRIAMCRAYASYLRSMKK